MGSTPIKLHNPVTLSLWNVIEEAREAAKEEGVGDGDEDGSAGTLRNSFRLHRRPVVPRLCLAAAELLRGIL